MTKYILHGGYPTHDNELNKKFFEEISRDLPEGASILVVHFAKKDETQWQSRFEEDKKNILSNADGKKLQVILATKDNFIHQIKKSDAIYLRGGEPDLLFNALKQYPEFTDAIKNKTVAGESAGAYVLSKYYYTHSQDMVKEGFGILPIKLICHYNNQSRLDNHGHSQQEILKKFDEYSKDLELVTLNDYEWRVIMVK